MYIVFTFEELFLNSEEQKNSHLLLLSRNVITVHHFSSMINIFGKKKTSVRFKNKIHEFLKCQKSIHYK